MARQKIADADTQLHQWVETVGAVKTVARCPLFRAAVYLEKGGRTWARRYKRPGGEGKESFVSLGRVGQSFAEIEAGEKAIAAMLDKGIDPGKEKLRLQQEQIAADAEAARLLAEARRRMVTLAQAADQFIAAHEASWSNPIHRKQWRSTLNTYVIPKIGSVPVADVTNQDVLKVLTPIWTTKPETASRVRGRLEAILDFSRVHGWRGALALNPAAWASNLKYVLPDPKKVRPVRHHAAMDWREIPTFVPMLRARRGAGGTALLFVILTACRSGEGRLARWNEVDFTNQIWTIGAERMKARREHRVPLSAPAIELLKSVQTLRQSGADDALVFPGGRFDVPLSDMTLTAVLRRMDRGSLTVHGFRSAFSDWAAETGQPTDIKEAALAHTLGKTQSAYQRGDLLERRRQLMAAWADFCLPDQRPTDKEVKEEPFGP